MFGHTKEILVRRRVRSVVIGSLFLMIITYIFSTRFFFFDPKPNPTKKVLFACVLFCFPLGPNTKKDDIYSPYHIPSSLRKKIRWARRAPSSVPKRITLSGNPRPMLDPTPIDRLTLGELLKSRFLAKAWMSAEMTTPKEVRFARPLPDPSERGTGGVRS